MKNEVTALAEKLGLSEGVFSGAGCYMRSQQPKRTPNPGDYVWDRDEEWLIWDGERWRSKADTTVTVISKRQLQINRVVTVLETVAGYLFIAALIAVYIWVCSKGSGSAQTFIDCKASFCWIRKLILTR
jgi:hypothetical protein